MAYWDDYFATLLSNPCNAFEQRKNGTINFSVTTWFRAVIKLIRLLALIRRVVINSSAFIFRYWALSACQRLRVRQCHTIFWKHLHFANALLYKVLNNNEIYEDELWMWKSALQAPWENKITLIDIVLNTSNFKTDCQLTLTIILIDY